MIADVSLRMPYLILDRFISWLMLLGRTSSAGGRHVGNLAGGQPVPQTGNSRQAIRERRLP